jgi:hypothetical protein
VKKVDGGELIFLEKNILKETMIPRNFVDPTYVVVANQ